MCGIGAVLDLSLQPVRDPSKPALLGMNELLAHRGPDGKGSGARPRAVGFAHRRLAIIDLETRRAADARRQPATDHLQRRDLQLPRAARRARAAMHFRSDSDTETILAPTTWGAGLPRPSARHVRLRALGRARARCSCARDRFGIKPFYYTPSSTTSSTSPPRSRRCCRSCRRSRPIRRRSPST